MFDAVIVVISFTLELSLRGVAQEVASLLIFFRCAAGWAWAQGVEPRIDAPTDTRVCLPPFLALSSSPCRAPYPCPCPPLVPGQPVAHHAHHARRGRGHGAQPQPGAERAAGAGGAPRVGERGGGGLEDGGGREDGGRREEVGTGASLPERGPGTCLCVCAGLRGATSRRAAECTADASSTALRRAAHARPPRCAPQELSVSQQRVEELGQQVGLLNVAAAAKGLDLQFILSTAASQQQQLAATAQQQLLAAAAATASKGMELQTILAAAAAQQQQVAAAAQQQLLAAAAAAAAAGAPPPAPHSPQDRAAAVTIASSTAAAAAAMPLLNGGTPLGQPAQQHQDGLPGSQRSGHSSDPAAADGTG